MIEHQPSKQSIEQAKAIFFRNEQLLDADLNDPMRKEIPFGAVENLGNKANEIILFEGR